MSPIGPTSGNAPAVRPVESKRGKGGSMAKRTSSGAVICPRCGVPSARVVGRSEIVWPLETMDYGQTEFGIRECDGYTLAFAEALEGE